ncbi:uncharacterized protein LOC106646050 [Copidosoma floridanum]|uniref:uncharacterized protein LOC106646050 n=1 Tax=Copidosoma floridanum TaxID=29053 RepID=UPI0006C94574|nr:uncharacterized protein LOC106646050 [Copidosoma floridanum]
MNTYNSVQINGVKLLLENKADPNIRDIYHKTALHYATQEKSRKIVEMLLIHKADPNIIDMNYRLPLDIAISLYKVGSTKKLITFGAKSSDIFRSLLSICQLNINRWTLKHKHFIRYILRRADVLYIHSEFSLKALLYYAEWDKHERFHQNQEKKTCILFEVLHKIGVSIDDRMGELDLHRASRHQNEEMVKALIRKGANVNVKNFYGETPLHLSLKAMESSYRENDGQKDYRIASLLLENGANIHEHDYIKETPFSLAIKIKCWPLLNLMLAKANVDLVTYENPVATESDDVSIRFCENNPKLHELIVAVAMGHENIVNQLLDKNFIDDTSKHPCQDLNAMMYVDIEKRQVNVVKILLEAGFRTDGYVYYSKKYV